jgi:hypothetical protein
VEHSVGHHVAAVRRVEVVPAAFECFASIMDGIVFTDAFTFGAGLLLAVGKVHECRTGPPLTLRYAARVLHRLGETLPRRWFGGESACVLRLLTSNSISLMNAMEMRVFIDVIARCGQIDRGTDPVIRIRPLREAAVANALLPKSARVVRMYSEEFFASMTLFLAKRT